MIFRPSAFALFGGVIFPLSIAVFHAVEIPFCGAPQIGFVLYPVAGRLASAGKTILTAADYTTEAEAGGG